MTRFERQRVTILDSHANVSLEFVILDVVRMVLRLAFIKPIA